MGPIAATMQGKVEGREKDGVLRFAAIPFASPPVGDRRFRPPAPAEQWDGVRDGTSFGAIAPQRPGMLGGLVAAPDTHADENCLVLNVWTPALDDGARPVMVWIHGGGFTGGTGATPWYDGSGFVRHGDVVVVTINYRLGALGFLHLPEIGGADYASSGLNGILDQVAALEWVRDNIAAFGGDPGNVTIFGESAGGMSVATLLGLPRARGLFHKAIAQSGAAHNVVEPDRAAEITHTFLEAADLDGLDALLAAAPDVLIAAQEAVSLQLMNRRVRERPSPRRATGAASGLALAMPFQPVLDGVELPVPPLDAVRAGSAAGVALMAGTTADEWNLFHVMSPGGLDDTRLLRRLDHLFDDGEAIAAAYGAGTEGVDADTVWCSVLTDAIFRVPSIRLLEAQSPHQPERTFAYRFSMASDALEGRLGACHALEIPYVFDTLTRGGVPMFLGREPGDADRSLAGAMHEAWWRFARTGDPSHPGLPDWPPYRPTTRETMELGPVIELRHDPDGARRAVWDDVL